MAYENTGYLAFANALSNAGQTFGNALEERYKRQSLADLAPMLQNGDYATAAKSAFESGNQDLGIKLSMLDAEKRKTAEQRAYDANALSGIYGPSDGASTGATGGVTPNPNPQPMNLSGGRYGVSQAYDLIKKVGGTDEEARTLAAISQPESSGNPMAHNPKGADDSYGLWQINMRGALGPERMKQFGLSKAEDLYNPETNAKAALALARSRGGYGDWSTYNSGKYRPFLQNGQPIQVADASGAVPASAVPGAPQPQPQQSNGQIDGLMSRRQNILRALSQQGISDNARQQLNTLLKDTEFQIERIDKQAQNANQSLSPYEKTRQEQQAKSEVEQAQQKAQQARSVDVIMPQLDRAEAAYKALAERKAIGPMMSSGLNRTLEASIPVEKWNQDEGLRQDFEAAQKELELYKAQISMKGQGQITESERKLLGLTLPRLDAAKPETGLETLRIMRDTMTKIRQESGSQPSLNRPPAYDVQKAREALLAGRSKQEVTDFLRSKGLSTDGIF